MASGARCVSRAPTRSHSSQSWLAGLTHRSTLPSPPCVCAEVLEGDYNAEFLFTAIAKQEPLLSVLRLACLHSLVHGGFKAKAFDQLRREIVQVRAAACMERSCWHRRQFLGG